MKLSIYLALALALIGLPASAQAPNLTTIQYVVPSITAQNWPTFVADAQGYYTREGLDVQMVQIDPSTLVSAVIGGSSQIALGDAAGLVFAVGKGANVVAIGSGADRVPYQLMSTPSIKTVKELKGQTMSAATPIEAYTYVAKTIMKKAGLDPDKDVHFIFGGGQNQRFAALLGGAVQAGWVTPPNDFILKQKGFNDLAFAPDYYPNLQLSITVTRRDWAQQHPQIVRGFLKAMADASRWLNNPANKEAAIALLAQKIKLSPEAASEAYGFYMTRLHEFPDDYCRIRPGMESLLTILHTEGQTKDTAANVGKYVSSEWCPK